MPVEAPSHFAQAIQEHLELKQRNSELERQMPLNTYKSDDPFENHPLFKTEEQARLEETMDGSEPAVVAHTTPAATLTWPGEESVEEAPPAATNAEIEDSLWGRESRDFDWGD
jgi:hypothetical protein